LSNICSYLLANSGTVGIQASAERVSDWVFGITNWGGLHVMGADLLVRVWDTAEGEWLLDSPARSLDKWAADLLAEGAEYLEET
jgi:hypothetical protein